MNRWKIILIAIIVTAFATVGCKEQETSSDEIGHTNILVIKMDELRHDQLGYMGHPIVQTPYIDQLAREANIFTNHYTVSPLCTPSRASFFTGQYTMHHGAKFVDMPNHLKADQHTFLNDLRDAGYTIGLAGKNHCFNDEYMEKYFDFREEYSHFGKSHGELTEKDKEIYEYLHNDPRPDFNSNQPDHEGKVFSEGLFNWPMPFKEEENITYRMAEDGMKFLEENQDNPFFLYYSFPDPHWPNIVAEPYYSMYNPDSLSLEGLDIDWASHPFAHFVQSVSQGYNKYTIEERKRILATMYGQITFCDKAIGMLLNKLNELDLRKNTIVVFTADHGNFGGYYGLIGKTKSFYDALVRVPLIISIPRVEGGNTFTANSENIDVFPTIMDYLGIQSKSRVQLPGKSLLPVLKKETADTFRDVIFSEVGLPQMPPDPMELDTFWQYRKQRIEEDGTTWFLDYTVNGRAAMVKKDNWKYCFYTNDMEELYNCAEDTLELNNLAGKSAYREKLSAMRDLWQEQILLKSMIDY